MIKDKKPAENAMRMIIMWEDMLEFCMPRTTCDGCPYKKKKCCDKQSTESVLRSASQVFREYLEE